MSIRTKKYDEEPVFYCKKCMSLAILNVDNYNYCRDCDSTDVDVCMIDEWEDKYETKYGYKYLNKK